MKFSHFPKSVAVIFCLTAGLTFVGAEPQHGIAPHGKPVLSEDFTSLPYVNPNAPKGGRIVFGEIGTFDSLNPLITAGRAPWPLRFQLFESLMGRSWDEPFGLYGLLAESVETAPNYEWVQFRLHSKARFSDGTPVTVEDVLWSIETLGTKGHGRYRGTWEKVRSSEKIDNRTIRVTFSVSDRELPLMIGLRPILKRAQWEGRDFSEPGLNLIPIGSSPYVIDDFEPGTFMTLRRDPDHWGKDLPFNLGKHNFDVIRYEFFENQSSAFQAFQEGKVDTWREFDAGRWEQNFDFPSVASGEVVKSLIPHRRPSGMTGFVMNTRRPVFKDWRVREAMIQLFNFEYINQSLNSETLPRITSYFSNSSLGMQEGPASGKVGKLLAPFRENLLPGTIEGYALPVSDGTDDNPEAIRRAESLLEQAGWKRKNEQWENADGERLTFEIVLNDSSTEAIKIAELYLVALKRAGISPRVSIVDRAKYGQRTSGYDFDMTYYRRGLSASPGYEQMLYWGSKGVSSPGTKNWMGMASPEAEAIIGEMLKATSYDDFLASVRALDRILTSGRYVIPIWQSTFSRLAHKKQLRFPER